MNEAHLNFETSATGNSLIVSLPTDFMQDAPARMRTTVSEGFPEIQHMWQDAWASPPVFCSFSEGAVAARFCLTAPSQRIQLDLAYETPRRSPELEWLDTHARELARLAGEWIVVDESGIVVHRKDYAEARAAAISRGIRIPFIFRVPDTGTDIFMGF